MSSQTLAPFAYIPENSQATPGLWNSVFSTLSQNIALVNSNATLTPPSGNTLTVGSDLSVLGTVAVSGPVRIGLSSNVTNYLFLSDTSNARSNYVIGSQVGGTADGLNFWDDSGQTMIVSFSKQSIRFYQNVVGPVFDLGGTAFNVKAYGAVGDGVASDFSAIKAAIDAITAAGGTLFFPNGIYLVNQTITVPTDRIVAFVGTGGFGSNQNGLSSSGCVIRAASALSGSTLISQATTVGPKFGLQMYGLCLDGNDQTVDLLYLQHATQVQIANTFFFNSNGNGLNASVIQDSLIHGCTFNEVGNGVAYPNGKSALVLNSDPTNNTNGVIISHCKWESLRGAALTSQDTSSANPIDIITIVGSKIESSGNFHGTATDVPVVRCNNASRWDVNGLMIVNGNSQSATQLQINNCVDSRFRVSCVANSSITTAIPQFLVDCQSGTNVYIGGTFSGGGANNGAQIRLLGSSLNSVLLDPTNIYSNPRPGGGNVSIVAPASYHPSFFFQPVASSADSSNAPGFTFKSELSLGFYRSGTSHVGLTYGALSLPDGAVTLPSQTFSSESSLGWYRSAASVMALSYGSLVIPAGPTQAVIAAFGATGDSLINYISIDGLRIGGENTSDTIYNATRNIYITRNSGGTVFLGQTSAGADTGLAVNTTTGASCVTGGTALAPTLAYSSEQSLGWWRSGSSTVKLSYGTLDLTGSGAVLSIASLQVKSGANNSCGTAVLGSNGSVNVANTYVKTGDLIFLTDQTPGGTLGDLEIGGIRNSSGFTIQSTSVTDTSTVAWLIVRPT